MSISGLHSKTEIHFWVLVYKSFTKVAQIIFRYPIFSYFLKNVEKLIFLYLLVITMSLIFALLQDKQYAETRELWKLLTNCEMFYTNFKFDVHRKNYVRDSIWCYNKPWHYKWLLVQWSILRKKVNFDTYFLNIFHKTLIKLLLFR